jgi:hypothetical protein
MHLDDLLGGGEAEASAARGFGVGASDLMEPIENALREYLAPYP